MTNKKIQRRCGEIGRSSIQVATQGQNKKKEILEVREDNCEENLINI